MKRIILFVTLAAVILSMVGCTKGSVNVDPGEMRDISTAALIAEMGAGWNLGNTMDAEGGETGWGNPKTTKEMIDEVHNAGFNVLRLPTSWVDHMGSGPEFTVDSEWMNRVEEIVGYAFANDMFVILNTHHETNWIKPTTEGVEKCKAKFEKLWTQIAEHFKDYGDHLIFEGLNEPRIVGSANEWNGGTEEERESVNQLNEIFVNTVRATGGNNATRTLLITTYAAQPVEKGIKALKIPDDKHVAVSIHAYTPYNFTYDEKTNKRNTTEYTATAKKDIKYLFDSLNEVFISKGVPVIITECGCQVKYTNIVTKETNEDDRAKWAKDYFSMAKELGIPCVLWDNGNHTDDSNELFGVFNRNKLTWYEPKIVEAIMEAIK